MTLLLRPGLAVVLAVGLLVTPAISPSPRNIASAAVIYESEGGNVLDCGFITCDFYISRSGVKTLAYDYDNEIDVGQALATMAACAAATRGIGAALCDLLVTYAMEEFVRDEIRKAASEGKCVRITFLQFDVPFGRLIEIKADGGELCRE